MGNRLFSDIIKLRQSHIGISWFLNPLADILIRRGRFGDRDQREEDHDLAEAEIGMMQL